MFQFLAACSLKYFSCCFWHNLKSVQMFFTFVTVVTFAGGKTWRSTALPESRGCGEDLGWYYRYRKVRERVVCANNWKIWQFGVVTVLHCPGNSVSRKCGWLVVGLNTELLSEYLDRLPRISRSVIAAHRQTWQNILLLASWKNIFSSDRKRVLCRWHIVLLPVKYFDERLIFQIIISGRRHTRSRSTTSTVSLCGSLVRIFCSIPAVFASTTKDGLLWSSARL